VKYFAFSAIGALSNMLAFLIVSYFTNGLAVAYIVGIAAGLVTSYMLYDFVVFRAAGKSIDPSTANADIVDKIAN
jgi:putative flippase GtrA